jgi:tRNA (guanosine-2'-O-)-methyltransferase
MDSYLQSELIKYLSGFVTEARLKRFEDVLINRTRHIAIGLENIYQPHNASAVLRSCDCFGIQDVHIVENENKYTYNPDVSLGSEKWLTINRYNDGAQSLDNCINVLRAKGYKIAVTSLHKVNYNIEEVPLNNKLALFFGTEMRGATAELESKADMYVKIPMLGFTESFNISVAAALSMYKLSSRLRKENIAWQLNESDKEELRLQWLRNTIPKVDLLEQDFMKKRG